MILIARQVLKPAQSLKSEKKKKKQRKKKNENTKDTKAKHTHLPKKFGTDYISSG